LPFTDASDNAMTVQGFRSWRGGIGYARKNSDLLMSRWSIAAFVVSSIALLCFAGRDGLVDFYRRLAFEEEYGHGFLVIGLVALIFYRRWPVFRSLSTGPKWPGLALVVAAQLCGLLGVLAESYFIEQVAFVLSLMGLMMVVYGARTATMLAPLALFLVLAIPFPYTLQAMVTVKLQLISTDIGVAIIRLLGIPVFVEGNIIDLGSYKLHVAEACSGLRYLLPLTCIGFILAYLYKAPAWKKLIVVASAPPLTILINSFRIALVGVLVDNFGLQMAEGFLHQLEGWVVFLIGGLLLGAEIIALERFRIANLQLGSILDRPTPRGYARPMALTGSALAALLTCAAAVGIATSITWAHESGPKPVHQNFAGFPSQIGEWKGRQETLEPEIVKTLKATDYYVGNFASPAKKTPVNFFVAYYESLNKSGAIHSPRVCLPGAGWEFASIEEGNFVELAPGTSGTFNRVLMQKGEQRALMYYWFQQRERRTANEFTAKYFLLVDGLTKNRKDGALVRIYTPIVAAGDVGLAEADARLHAFANAVLPQTGDYLPQ
jgi:exosortase D (VPLPA-CTERM-specific)